MLLKTFAQLFQYIKSKADALAIGSVNKTQYTPDSRDGVRMYCYGV